MPGPPLAWSMETSHFHVESVTLQFHFFAFYYQIPVPIAFEDIQRQTVRNCVVLTLILVNRAEEISGRFRQ